MPFNRTRGQVDRCARICTSSTTAWMRPAGHVASTHSRVYASTLSTNSGQKHTFLVSVQKDGTPFTLPICRVTGQPDCRDMAPEEDIAAVSTRMPRCAGR